MSSTLYWRPRLKAAKSLPDHLKIVLRNSNTFAGGLNVTLDRENIGYLSGLRDAGVEGADKLIEAIEKHGEVELVEEF
jgi:hypothetical protein